jgi:hypothetical protein
MIKVMVMSQKMVAIQSKYKPEMDEFRKRIDEARAEGNNMISEFYSAFSCNFINYFSSASVVGTARFLPSKEH